jgi:hypothetical protein
MQAHEPGLQLERVAALAVGHLPVFEGERWRHDEEQGLVRLEFAVPHEPKRGGVANLRRRSGHQFLVTVRALKDAKLAKHDAAEHDDEEKRPDDRFDDVGEEHRSFPRSERSVASRIWKVRHRGRAPHDTQLGLGDAAVRLCVARHGVRPGCRTEETRT